MGNPVPNDQSERERRLVNDIFKTRPDEIQYDQAMRLMEHCAAELLADEQAQHRYPQLWRYFEIYPHIKAEYDMLMELARMDAAGQVSKPDRLPPLPGLEDTSQEAVSLQSVVRALFPGFSTPQFALARRADAGASFAPVAIQLNDGLSLECEIHPHSNRPESWDLFCTLLPGVPELAEALEFSSAWLVNETGILSQEATIDASGDLAFEQLLSGTYALHFNLSGQEYTITGLQLPKRDLPAV